MSFRQTDYLPSFYYRYISFYLFLKMKLTAAIAALLVTALGAKAFTIADVRGCLGYQCDEVHEVHKVPDTAIGHIQAFSTGVGAAAIGSINPTCRVLLCFAGYGCGDGNSPGNWLPENTCQKAKLNGIPAVYDKFVIQCD
ncbi:hypothetical protein BGZ63DRAFT_423818 [Mariannaea sp. PMI_226]|nr:hypothetical protein BGZ63DRAFT_423818 [Mariannaea sp. PMI_226]